MSSHGRTHGLRQPWDKLDFLITRGMFVLSVSRMEGIDQGNEYCKFKNSRKPGVEWSVLQSLPR